MLRFVMAWLAIILAFFAFSTFLPGCGSDDPVVHSDSSVGQSSDQDQDGPDLCKQVEQDSDGCSGTWTFTYNKDGKVVESSYVDNHPNGIYCSNSKVQKTEYDTVGNEIHWTESHSEGFDSIIYNETTTEYDTANRPITKVEYYVGEPRIITTWLYKGKNLIQEQNANLYTGETTTEDSDYYPSGLLKSYRITITHKNGVTWNKLETYQYNKSGQMVDRCSDEGFGDLDPEYCHQTVWTYQGNLVQTELTHGWVTELTGYKDYVKKETIWKLLDWVTYEYDDQDRIILENTGSSQESYEDEDPYEWVVTDYNEELEVTKTFWDDDSTVPKETHREFFDEEGRTIKIIDTQPMSVGLVYTEETHEYDNLGREVVYELMNIGPSPMIGNDDWKQWGKRIEKTYGNCREE